MGDAEAPQKDSLIGSYGLGLFFCLFGVLFFTMEHLIASGFISLGFILIGTFFLSVARVRLENEALKYRIWLRSRKVSYSEIVDCGESWVFGYIKCRRYVFPWGKIYFARGQANDSLFGWDKKIISSIRNKAGIAI